MQKRPSVGNGLWVVPLTDPDGYRIDFKSPTDAPRRPDLIFSELNTHPTYTSVYASLGPSR